MQLTKKEMRKMLEECRVVLGFKKGDVQVDVPAHIELLSGGYSRYREGYRDKLRDLKAVEYERDQLQAKLSRLSRELKRLSDPSQLV
tara:strand:+ start:571 stop:831 length:261 start_codon:yes stop_codon:yes gene_type:complete